MEIIIEIARNYPAWAKKKAINKALIKKLCHNVMQRFDGLKNFQKVELSILLTHDEEMQHLNSQFRKIPKATNVLSFPDQILNFQHLLEMKADLGYIYLGDIAFGYQIIENESLEHNKTFQNHFIHLFIHSILHLIGFDHQTKSEAKFMEELEIKILEDFAISSPY